ncbi:MAG: phage tail assembly protein [Verrucomicrobiae bacterium]|nr:phage tail assembly protein [Verrucomicrobiae bacterium]
MLEEIFGKPANRLVFDVLGQPGRSAVGREYLPADKRQPLRELEGRYAQLSAETIFPVGDPLDEEDRAALEDLQRRKRSEIEYLLTPQELEELDLRESTAARYVRTRLPEAQTEAEFRAMVLAAREAGVQERIMTRTESIASRYGMGTPSGPRESPEEKQRKAIEARIKELLGEQRWAQMQQAEAARQAAQQARWEAEQKARGR